MPNSPPLPRTGFITPTVGGDPDQWGTELNTGLQLVDSSFGSNPVNISTSGTTLLTQALVYERITTGSGTITRTLPSPSYPREVIYIKVDSGPGTVVIAATINGSAAGAQLVGNFQYIRLMWNGASWDAVGGN